MPQQALRIERGARPGVMRFERLIPVAWDAEVSKAKPVLSEGLLTISVPKRNLMGEEKKK